MTARVLLVEDSPGVRRGICQALTAAGYKVSAAPSGAEALESVSDFQPNVVLLDIGLSGMDGYEVCRRLRQEPQTARTPIMMLTALDSVSSKVKAFEAGADDYLVKPFDVKELFARIEALQRRSPKPQAAMLPEITAKIIALFSLRGGVGTSTLATNLAVSLAQIWECKTALVDLALVNGQAALMLNLSLDRTWTSLADIAVEEIDFGLLDKVLLEHPSGVRVLAAPSQAEEATLIDAEKITRVLDVLSERFEYIVLDLAHNFQDVTLAGLDAAHEILLVVGPDVASVRTTASAIQVFRMLNYSPDKIQLVLNRISDYGLTRRDIQTTLKRRIDVEIPFAPKEFVSALNLGVPLTLQDPDSELSFQLQEFAFQLSTKEHKDRQPEAPSAAWQRVVDRKRERGRTGELVRRALAQLGPQISYSQS